MANHSEISVAVEGGLFYMNGGVLSSWPGEELEVCQERKAGGGVGSQAQLPRSMAPSCHPHPLRCTTSFLVLRLCVQGRQSQEVSRWTE